jgi:ABC-type transporter Mla subunit MlaD
LSPTGGKATTTVRFKAPGTYVLRATATDSGGLAINKDVTVAVK